MPKTLLLRRDIVDKYRTDIHPSDEPFRTLPLLEQTALLQTCGVNYNSEQDPAPSAHAEDASAAPSVIPDGSSVKPMLHQEDTALKILANLQQGFTTAVLGDPLGAGKTYQALLTFLHLRLSNPKLRIVITVPDVVISDWKEALSSLGFTQANWQIIINPAAIASIDPHKLPTILLVKQNLTLIDTPSHNMASQKLQAIYSLPCLYVFDEKPSSNQANTFISLFNSSKRNPRLILSGTVVTNSIQDFNQHFEKTHQLGSPLITGIMKRLTNFFSRYFTTNLAGTKPAIPGQHLIDMLNLSAITRKTFHSRMPSNLPILLPQAAERFVCFDAADVADVAATTLVREEPVALLTSTGAEVRIDYPTNLRFLDSLESKWHPKKLQLLIAKCTLPRPPSEITDILVVTASQRTTTYLMTTLPQHIESANYVCIRINDEERETKIQEAHAAGLSVVLITESAKVEGFNVQEHLRNIIFFDAVREAGDYAQAVGRGVRRGNLKQRVEIEQYCSSATVDYVRQRLFTTRKAKTLLDLIHADPTAVFLLLTQDVLVRNQQKLQPHASFEAILKNINGILFLLSEKLQDIMKTADSQQAIKNFINLKTLLPVLSGSFSHLFLFEENITQFAFNELSSSLLTEIKDLMQFCKKHFLKAIISLDLPVLLEPPYLYLANGFNLVGKYLLALQRGIEGASTPIKLEHSFKALNIVYSLTKEVFPQYSAIKNALLLRLKENSFFNELSFEQLFNEPFLMFALIDTNDPDYVSSLIKRLLIDALGAQPEKVYGFLCRFGAYASETTQMPLEPIFESLYTGLQGLATERPREIYSNKLYDILVEHFKKHAEWLGRLYNFEQSFRPKHQSEYIDMASRRKELWKLCTKEERKALQISYGEYLTSSSQPRGAVAVEEEEEELKIKKRRTNGKQKANDGAAAEESSVTNSWHAVPQSFFTLPRLTHIAQPEQTASSYQGHRFFNPPPVVAPFASTQAIDAASAASSVPPYQVGHEAGSVALGLEQLPPRYQEQQAPSDWDGFVKADDPMFIFGDDDSSLPPSHFMWGN